MSFWIVTDSCTDFPPAYIAKQRELTILPLTYQIEGRAFVPDGSDASNRALYAQLRAGKISTTSQINSETWKETFQKILEEGHDILAVIFSSGLSGTYQAAVAAKEELEGRYPERELVVVDSLCASLGEGLLVHYALEKRAQGLTLQETAQWVRDNVQHLNHWFTVDDLQFLRRGGRVSAAAAYFGGLIKIKPILHVNWEGRLIPREKVQGRKRSLRVLCEKVKEFAVNPQEQVIFISHGDCLEEAQALAQMVREAVHPKDIMLGYVGAVIGSHSGPGTMAIFFLGKGR